MNMYWIAATWVALALIASLISIRAGISVALVEILVGAVVGNIPGAEHVVQQTQFTSFLATLGSAVLTFLAGAEIDPDSLRRNWKARLGLGLVSFAAPFAGALLFARFALGWAWPAAQIAGVSLSTTSVAVVYAVMIESGLNRQEIGKLILPPASSPTWAPFSRSAGCSPTSTGSSPSSSPRPRPRCGSCRH